MEVCAKEIARLSNLIKRKIRFVECIFAIPDEEVEADKQEVFEQYHKQILTAFALLQKSLTSIHTIKSRYDMPVEPLSFSATCGLEWAAIPQDWLAVLYNVFPVTMREFLARHGKKIRTDGQRAPWDHHQPFVLELCDPSKFDFDSLQAAFVSAAKRIGAEFLCVNKDKLNKRKKEEAKAAIVRKYVKPCCICMDNTPDTALNDCGHKFCRDCAQKAWDSNACYTCKQPIRGILKVHDQ